MTNVIPLRKPKPPSAEYLILETAVDVRSPLVKGSHIAVCWPQDEACGGVIFQYWYGPTGRDSHGRFVKRGSPHEAIKCSGMSYTAEDIQTGWFKILGRVMGPSRVSEAFRRPETPDTSA